MKKEMIVRAWKDPEYRARLSVEERAALPDCPSGSSLAELDEAELLGAVGGRCGPRYSQHLANSCGIACTVITCRTIAC